MKHNSREKGRDAVLIIKMEGNSTYIKDPSSPEQEPKKYTFDHSYWSHDGFKERQDGYLEPANQTYADQVKFININNYQPNNDAAISIAFCGIAIMSIGIVSIIIVISKFLAHDNDFPAF